MSEYDLTYESKRSYYDLFDAAGISWKKTTSLNPKAGEDAVAAKKKRLKHCWQGIGRKSCHLMWGNLSGYVWGKTDQ